MTRPAPDDVPPVHFARAGRSSIAYQVIGEGPATVVSVPPMAQNIELAWEWPSLRYMFHRLGSFSRFIHFDKRGTGMSDRSLDIPALDERVDELRAVMDDVGVEHAYLFGASEGGPMALMFAATYPDRVDGVMLQGSGACLLPPDIRRARLDGQPPSPEARARWEEFCERWGTADTLTPPLFAPSQADDAEFRAWWPRYERQAASRDALMKLLEMNSEMDVIDVLDQIRCPVLLLHRVGDRVIPVDVARDTAARLDRFGADVRLVELPGEDHFMFSGDLDAMVDEMERFVTGTVDADRSAELIRHRVTVTTLGRFAVTVDDREVETGEWGSRRARTLLKRLAVARGRPVSRDELFQLLWPDEPDPSKLGPRLSVQLSAVRRVLHGGVAATSDSVRLDIDTVGLDLDDWFAVDDDAAIVAGYAGMLLPDDIYDDWSEPFRTEVTGRFVATGHRLLDGDGDHHRRAELAGRLLEADGYDDRAHRVLIRAHDRAGRPAEARAAHTRYREAMAELGIDVDPIEAVVET